MAVSTDTYTVNAGWGRTDVLTLLEQGIAFAGKHGAAISGVCTDVQAFHGGGTVGSAGTYYYDVPQHSTSGIGTGATFNVRRYNGVVTNLGINKVGSGYAEGDTVTIDASEIGGTSQGAAGIGLTVHVHGAGAPVSFGSASKFFLQNNAPSTNAAQPWAVQRHVHDATKKYGQVFRSFNIQGDNYLDIMVGPSFGTDDVNRSGGNMGMYGHSFRGTYLLDLAQSQYGDTLNQSVYSQVNDLRFASSSGPTTHDLRLNVYKSGIDSKFTVFSFEQPSVSGPISSSTFATFFLHDFDHSLLDLDEVMLGGLTVINPQGVQNSANNTSVKVAQDSTLVGNRYHTYNYYSTTRYFESGWMSTYSDQHQANTNSASTVYASVSGPESSSSNGNMSYQYAQNGTVQIYNRNNGHKDKGMIEQYDQIFGNRTPITQRKLVIKGIPLQQALVPTPYYLPDDFVYIDLDIGTSEVDIKQGDTITVSGSEVYTIIHGCFNKYQSTAGIFFCARTT